LFTVEMQAFAELVQQCKTRGQMQGILAEASHRGKVPNETNATIGTQGTDGSSSSKDRRRYHLPMGWKDCGSRDRKIVVGKEREAVEPEQIRSVSFMPADISPTSFARAHVTWQHEYVPNSRQVSETETICSSSEWSFRHCRDRQLLPLPSNGRIPKNQKNGSRS